MNEFVKRALSLRDEELQTIVNEVYWSQVTKNLVDAKVLIGHFQINPMFTELVDEAAMRGVFPTNNMEVLTSYIVRNIRPRTPEEVMMYANLLYNHEAYLKTAREINEGEEWKNG